MLLQIPLNNTQKSKYIFSLQIKKGTSALKKARFIDYLLATIILANQFSFSQRILSTH